MGKRGKSAKAAAPAAVAKKAKTEEKEAKEVQEAIVANPKSLSDFKAGKDSAINGFKGSIMKAAKGKADPKLVDQTLRQLLAARS